LAKLNNSINAVTSSAHAVNYNESTTRARGWNAVDNWHKRVNHASSRSKRSW